MSRIKSFEFDIFNTTFSEFLLHINSNFNDLIDIYNLSSKIFTKLIVEPRRFYTRKIKPYVFFFYYATAFSFFLFLYFICTCVWHIYKRKNLHITNVKITFTGYIWILELVLWIYPYTPKYGQYFKYFLLANPFFKFINLIF